MVPLGLLGDRILISETVGPHDLLDTVGFVEPVRTIGWTTPGQAEQGDHGDQQSQVDLRPLPSTT